MKRRSEVAVSPVTKVRTQVARVVWLLFALAALFLAVGALMVALDANTGNALVKFVIDTADRVDLGVFSRQDGIKHFTGQDATTKNALFNWGLGAVAWLVVGRIVERLIRP
ncbi:hypothetical protein FB382_000984 [Nocardioides ginsengisegetis]|uniref:Uncharacterized protein n=1 Tax=Nocardioides ginsengisegetis TaxID=661491 RepID=A0A7W3P8Q2_9ACTN|nr:hypothetical protein [Nocardioides ginsengisegetis]MBA8802693.1 hypothetical protein [Nocardioides ginsengisegetis]